MVFDSPTASRWEAPDKVELLPQLISLSTHISHYIDVEYGAKLKAIKGRAQAVEVRDLKKSMNYAEFLEHVAGLKQSGKD